MDNAQEQERESFFHLNDSTDHDTSAIITTEFEANDPIILQSSTATLDEVAIDVDKSQSILFLEESTCTALICAESVNSTPLKNNITTGLSQLDISNIDVAGTSPLSNNLQISTTNALEKRSHSILNLAHLSTDSRPSKIENIYSLNETGNESRPRSILNLTTHLSTDSEPSKNQKMNEKRTIAECIGDEMLKIICSKDSKKSIPLLSICCTVTNLQKAQMMIGRKIGKREWTKAKMHAIFPGPGEPLYKNFWVNHRQRVKDEQLIQFMEWLKAADLIQNLSFGHKVVQYHNGLHVAIESVKRTDTLKNISKRYYAQFLDKVVEDAEDLNQKDEAGDDEYESDISDYEQEEEDDDGNNECNWKDASEFYCHGLLLVLNLAFDQLIH